MESSGLLMKGSFMPSMDTETMGKNSVPIWVKTKEQSYWAGRIKILYLSLSIVECDYTFYLC